MQPIGRNIFYEANFAGVTLGAIIMPRGTILIDAPLRAEDSRTWNETILKEASVQLEANGDEVLKEHILVYLDAHPDRTIGARVLENTGQIPTIIAHQETARGFDNRPSVFRGQNPDTGAEWEICEDIITTRWALPDIIFTDQLHLYWDVNNKNNKISSNDITNEVIFEHHPGPSAGSIWVHVPHQKVLFIGDTVIISQPPFLESANIPLWLSSLDKLLSYNNDGYTIISGRGAKISANEIHNQIFMLKRIQQLLDAFKQRIPSTSKFEDMVSNLLSKMEISQERWSLYYLRMKYGLQYYYNRHYLEILE